MARKIYDVLGLHGKVSLPQSINWSKTKALTTIRSTGEGVSINLAGREMDGIVDPGDYEKVRDEVMDRLGSFVDPKTGNKPIKAIHKRERSSRASSPIARPTSCWCRQRGTRSRTRAPRSRTPTG